MAEPEILVTLLGSCGKSVIPEGDWSIKPVSSSVAPSDGFPKVITVTIPDSILTCLIDDTLVSQTYIYNPSEVKEMKEGFEKSLLVFNVIVDCVWRSMRLNLLLPLSATKRKYPSGDTDTSMGNEKAALAPTPSADP